MKIIIFEEETYYKMLEELKQVVKEATSSDKEWLSTEEAKELLGIKSKTRLQQLRDNLDIEFSKYGKIIRYSRSSILKFLERHRVKY